MIVFRVDANEKIATGHLMRCLAIAEECRKQGEICQFLLAENKETDRIAERGFSYHVLNSVWDQLDAEVVLLQQYLENNPCDWLVVDSYQATSKYLRRLNELCPILYLDDFGEEEYAVTAVLHYGVMRNPEEYARGYSRRGVRALVGSEYIPLREEFQPDHLAELQKKQWDRQFAQRQGERLESDRFNQEQDERSDPDSMAGQPGILITTGGTDPYHVTEKVLEYCLADRTFFGYRYHVVVGSMNDHVQELRQMAEQYAVDGISPISLHFGVKHMSDLMCQCDYAVSAGGTTLYELCACGVPTVCFSFADNQLTGVRLLAEQQIMYYAGDAREGDVSVEIGRYLSEYIRHPEDTIQYQNRMRELVDGRGVCRIAAFLCQKHGDKNTKFFQIDAK